LTSVIRALRGQGAPLTVIVSIAYEQQDGDEARQRITGASVEDLRRSLEALSGEEGALARAIRRPLTFERLGRHPLGNLVIASAAAGFDDYGQASLWLGEQLGIDGAVLPATTEPVRREIEIVTEAVAGGGERTYARLRLIADRVEAPAAAVSAIERAQCAILAPGSLYRSILSTAAVPELASALRRTDAPVVWVANLEPESGEAGNLSSMDHLLALRMHGVRVDVVLHDPSATVTFEPAELEVYGVRSMVRPLRGRTNPGVHDPQSLRSALDDVVGSPSHRAG
jgi:uncharacterized cofD-like protein